MSLLRLSPFSPAQMVRNYIRFVRMGRQNMYTFKIRHLEGFTNKLSLSQVVKTIWLCTKFGLEGWYWGGLYHGDQKGGTHEGELDGEITPLCKR